MVLHQSKSKTSAKCEGSTSNNKARSGRKKRRRVINKKRNYEANGEPFEKLPFDSSKFIFPPMPSPEHEICSKWWITKTCLINSAMLTRMSSEISRLTSRECSQSIDPREFTLSPMPHLGDEISVMRCCMETAHNSFTLLSMDLSVISKMDKCFSGQNCKKTTSPYSGEFTLSPMPPPKDLIASRRWIMETHCATNAVLHRMWSAISRIGQSYTS